MYKKTIGIVGCGAIGSYLADYACENMTGRISGVVIWDKDAEKSESLYGKVPRVKIAGELEELAEQADLIIEAASPMAVPGLFEVALEKGKDLIVMSIGGLLGNEHLLAAAREKGIRLMLPSGAIAGIDALKASKIAGLESVTITTRKAPRSVKGAPYLADEGIDVDSIDKETVIFEGNALEAIKGFPKNINVSALLSIAGLGGEKTKVRIIVSPEYTRNSHEVEMISGAGRVLTRTENTPSPSNPKTSYLAALAAITSLQGYFDTVRIGT
ncbi:MAG: aspartate dehydrogenase [Candidatus Omnitrophica bacterium]|nr:aspartate dehydrogenase [Candidatus Omnitrophota bacterium]